MQIYGKTTRFGSFDRNMHNHTIMKYVNIYIIRLLKLENIINSVALQQGTNGWYFKLPYCRKVSSVFFLIWFKERLQKTIEYYLPCFILCTHIL